MLRLRSVRLQCTGQEKGLFESISDTSLILQHCVMAVLEVESALSDTEPHLFQGELASVRADVE